MSLETEETIAEDKTTENDVFSNLQYICSSSSLITDSLQKGLDVAQLSNGDIVVTEVKTVNTRYSWHKTRKKLVRISRH